MSQEKSKRKVGEGIRELVPSFSFPMAPGNTRWLLRPVAADKFFDLPHPGHKLSVRGLRVCIALQTSKEKMSSSSHTFFSCYLQFPSKWEKQLSASANALYVSAPSTTKTIVRSFHLEDQCQLGNDFHSSTQKQVDLGVRGQHGLQSEF